jgi:hypothetical protein
VKTTDGERALEDKTGTGRLVTGPDRGLLGQADEELSNLHEICRKLEHLRLVGSVLEDRSSDRLVVDIETDKCYITHGWTPF